MSFSTDVKNELARFEIAKKCCEKAELLGLLKMNGALALSGLNLGIHFLTENAALARRVLQLLKANYQVQTEVVVTRSRRLHKNNRYQIRVLPSPMVAQALRELQLLPGQDDNTLLKHICCRRSFLRGVFLAGGSLNNPSGDYHLEIVTQNEDFAGLILKIMRNFNLPAKITDRKENYIVYLKDGSGIKDFLSLIGAYQGVLDFENVRIVKEMRNKVNRVVNCETANLNKVVNAAVRQVACIHYLQRQPGYYDLPLPLRETADLRLAHPDISLGDLVEYTEGALGKSGLNHRLQKLQRLAVDWGMPTSPK